MPSRRIPRQLAELTSESLGWILHPGEASPAPTGELRWERIGEGEGMMGDVARVRLAPGGTTPRTLIAKLPAAHRGNRGQAELLGLYEREIRFYRELATDCAYPTPRLLGAALDDRPAPDPDADAKLARLPRWLARALLTFGLFLAGRIRRGAVLLLEDLAPAEAGDQVAGLSADRLAQVLTAVARGHARSWNHPSLSSAAWLPTIDAAPTVLGLTYERARRRAGTWFEARVPPDVLALADAANARVGALTAALATPPWTLLHGDLRADNLFFRGPTPADVVFTDWQVPARGRGVYDVAYLLSGTLAREVPVEEERAWVDHYHRALCEAGVLDYDLARCQQDYRLALLLILPRVLTAGSTVDFANARGARLQEELLARLVARIERRTDAELRAALDSHPV